MVRVDAGGAVSRAREVRAGGAAAPRYVARMKPETEKTAEQQPAPAKLRYTPKPKDSWKKLIGRMKDCDLRDEAFRLGAEWRARMNREGR